MNRSSTTFFSGLLVGAGLMYMLDPARGNRRRALVRDQVVHGGRVLEDLGERITGKSQDLRNRAYGAVQEARSRLRDEHVDGPVLEARVRSEIGRVVANPGSIQVTALDGRVALSGPVLEREMNKLLACVAAVRGVHGVENRLQPHPEPADVPGLQGARAEIH
jgi:hypothetical protein